MHFAPLITLIVMLAALAPDCHAAAPELRDTGGRDNFLILNKDVYQFDHPPAVSKPWSPNNDPSFSITNRSEGSATTCLFAHNGGESPVSATIKITAEDNAAYDHEFPLFVVVPPKTDTCVARITPKNKKYGVSFHWGYLWIHGDYRAENSAPDGYRLPVSAEERTALPGSVAYSSADPSTVNAVDFAVDPGAPILAARGGIVIGVKDVADDGPTVSGYRASSVDVLHDDGTIASYLFVAEKSSAVKVGQRVSTGEKLALAAASDGHPQSQFRFVVWKPTANDTGFERISLPVQFCLNGKCARLAGEVKLGKDRGIIAGKKIVANPGNLFDDDGPVAVAKLKGTVRELLSAEKYAQLESLAKELRRAKAQFRDGTWKLHAFFDGVTAPDTESRAAWEAHLRRLERWRKQYPKSVTSLTALTSALNNVCWYAYGAGYASFSREEYGKLYNRRQSAIQAFERLKVASADDCPERHLLFLVLAKSEGLEKAAYDKLFKKAVAFEPRYFHFHLAKMDYLSDEMFGSPGERLRFVEHLVTRDGKEGRAIYFRVLAAKWQALSMLSFDDVSWSQAKEGYAEMEKRYPDSAWNLNVFCHLACIAGDKPTAQRLFAKIGDQPYPEAWEGSREIFEKWRAWAGSTF